MSEPREPDQPGLADALSAAARRTAFARVAPGEDPSARALLAALGGVRGLVEAILPGLGFLVVYTVTGELLPSVVAPVALALAFVAVRLVTGSQPAAAVAGVVGVAASAALALWSGRAEDNFLLGFLVNAGSIVALTVSLLLRWPLVGVIVGLLTGDVAGWRADRARFRVAAVATGLWIGLFALRLGVQLPLYLAGQTQLLAATKLVMGVPLYAMLLWVTWLLVRAAYPPGTSPAARPGQD